MKIIKFQMGEQRLCIISSSNEELLEYIEIDELNITNYSPITGSYVILECNNQILLGFNTWRKQWELPSGGIEEGETLRECAKRELYEETCQDVNLEDLVFKGLVKIFHKQKNEIRFRGVFYSKTNSISSFTKNYEISSIMMWSPKDKMKNYDVVDFEIINRFREN